MTLRVIIIALLLWGLMAPWAQAAPARLTVAVGSDSVPFYFKDKQGLPQGLVVDLWKLWSRKTGVAVEFKSVPFGQTLTLVAQGQADVHAGCFQSPQRQEFLDFVVPVCNVQTNLFVHQNIFGVEGLDGLRGFRVGVIAGDYALEYLEGKLPPSSLAIYPDNVALFEAIARGEVLVFIKDTAIALDQLARLGLLHQYRFDIERPLYQRPWVAAVRRGNTQLAELVRQGMEQITPEERAALELRWVKSASVKTKERLVISCPKGNAPFTILTPSARPAGLLVDIWRLWAQKTGRQIEFRFEDWAGSLRALELGQADIHSGLFHTAERAWRMDFSTPFYGAPAGVFYNPRYLRPARVEDLAGQEVGVVAGSFLDQHLRDNHPEMRIKAYADSDVLIRAAADGQVKAFAAEVAAAMANLDRLGERGSFRRLEGWQISRRIHAAVRKGDQELSSLVAAGFEAIGPQELAEIERRWISAPEMQYLGGTPALPRLSPEEKAWLEDHKVIVLGAAQDYPPLEFMSEDGVHQGLAAEYLGLLEKRLGVRLRAVSAFAWSDMLEKVKRKELAGAACIAQSEDRESFLKFSKPYFYSPYMVFTSKGGPAVASLGELDSQTVAVENGFYLHGRLREEYPRIKLLTVPNTQAALEAVAAGQARAYVGNLLVAEYIIKREALADLRIACTAPWPGAQLRIGVRPDWPQLVSILDKALDTITTQEQAEINSRWLPPRATTLAGSLVMTLTPKERAWLEGKQRLRLGVDPNWPPFEYIGPDRAYAGMASDYVRLLAEKLGLVMEVVPGLTWTQALEGTRTGQVDLLASAAQTPERSKFLNFTKPYLTFPMVVVTRDDAPFITGLEGLAGKTVAVGQGYISHELLANNHPELKLQPVGDIKQGLLAVSQGSAQALVDNLASITHFTREAGLTNLKIAASTPYSFDLCFAVRQDWPELAGILEKALAEISPAEKARIHDSWVSMRFEHGVDWAYVWRMLAAIVGVCLAVLALFVYWNRRLQKAVRQRRQAEEALGKSEAQLRALVDSSADTIIVLDTGRRIIDCNQAFSEQFGYQRPEAIGQSARLVHPDDQSFERFGREVYPQVRDQGSWRGEWLYMRRDGSTMPMENVMSAFRGPDGAIGGYSAVMRDITARKRTEAALEAARQELEDRVAQRTAELESVVQALQEEIYERQQVEISLRKSEEEHRAVLNASPNCIIAYDNQGKVVYVNPAFTRVFGWSAQEVIGQRLDFIPEPERDSAANAVKEAYRLDGGVYSFESRLYTKQGQIIDVSINITVFLDVAGKPVGLLAALEDISERKRNEEELNLYRQELEHLVEARTAELAVAMEKAQEADRLKSAFLASMSHELRTPLNSIIGFTGIILQGLVGPLNDEQAKQMGMVQHSARHLLSLINDVLDISKIEAGQLKVEPQPFDMAKLIAEVHGGLRPLADKKGLVLECRVGPEVGRVVSDRRRVEQILINLLNNAVKFTEQGGVYLDCRVQDGHVLTSVRDTGIGIKPGDQAKLFQPFRQIDTGLARRYEGTGLGLNICKKLVDMLGGGIWVQSAGENQGSTFSFTLPLEGRGEHA
ncbi:MAG: transporter substrate-binding domain-containing protein [Desulfarculus sp.]|nr:transporter substrate-binding domain-containing protein [Desulfarculus sp.]